jgi:mRNA interferase MazF
MVKKEFVPDRGEIIRINFTPQAGREQAGKRPALVLTPKLYNQKTRLAIMCPITSQKKGYPFEVALLTEHGRVDGVVLVDHLKSLDWRERQAEFWDKVRCSTLDEVIAKIRPLIGV